MAAFPEARGQQFFLGLKEGADAGQVARAVERTLVQAPVESLQEILDEQARSSNGFMLIFQGFMGLGLIVGV